MSPSEDPLSDVRTNSNSSHNYSFSFCPKPDWPGYYATAQQIHGYMKDVAQKYESDKYIKCNHTVQSAIWNEATGKWELKIKNGDGVVFADECDVFVNAGGVLKYVLSFLVLIPGPGLRETLATGNGHRLRGSSLSRENCAIPPDGTTHTTSPTKRSR